jgi:hypothetical protein
LPIVQSGPTSESIHGQNVTIPAHNATSLS